MTALNSSQDSKQSVSRDAKRGIFPGVALGSLDMLPVVFLIA